MFSNRWKRSWWSPLQQLNIYQAFLTSQNPPYKFTDMTSIVLLQNFYISILQISWWGAQVSGSKARPLGLPPSLFLRTLLIWVGTLCSPVLGWPQRFDLLSIRWDQEKGYGTTMKTATIAPWPKLPLFGPKRWTWWCIHPEFLRATQEGMINHLML